MEGTRISSHAAEGKAMRQLMKDFDARKVIFHSNYGQDIYLELPAPLDDLNIPGKVNEGQIIIKRSVFGATNRALYLYFLARKWRRFLMGVWPA